MPPEGQAFYRKSYEVLWRIQNHEMRVAIDADRVARAVQQAMEARTPRLRYPVGAEARLARFLGLLPGRLVDWLVATWHHRVAAKMPV
jgi:hypothetical protein